MPGNEEELFKEIENTVSVKTLVIPLMSLVTLIAAITTLVTAIQNYDIRWYWVVITCCCIMLSILVYSYLVLSKLLVKTKVKLAERIKNHRALARQHEEIVEQLDLAYTQNLIMEEFIRAILTATNQAEQERLQLLLERTRRHLNG